MSTTTTTAPPATTTTVPLTTTVPPATTTVPPTTTTAPPSTTVPPTTTAPPSGAVDVPARSADQVKVDGAELDKVVEAGENMDGGPNKADHTVGTGRVHDFGVSSRDQENQSAQRILRQDVKKAGGSPGLVGPEVGDGDETGGKMPLSYT